MYIITIGQNNTEIACRHENRIRSTPSPDQRPDHSVDFFWMKPYQPALRLARPGLQELGQSRVHSSARSSGRASRRQSKPSLSHFQRVALPPQQQSAQHSRRRTSYETERQTASAVLRQYNKRTKPDDFAFSAQDVSRSFERLPYYEANPAAVVPTLRHGLEEVLKTPNTIHLLRSADAIDEVADRETSTSSAEVRHIDAPDLDIMPKYSDINMKVIAHFVPPSADPRLVCPHDLRHAPPGTEALTLWGCHASFHRLRWPDRGSRAVSGSPDPHPVSAALWSKSGLSLTQRRICTWTVSFPKPLPVW